MKLPKNYVAVHRMPPAKNLFAHELALATGLFLVLISVFFEAAIIRELSVWQHILILAVFCCGTLLGGIFTWIVFLFVLLGYSAVIPDQGLWRTLFEYAVWYLIGYISGYALGQFYNYLVYFYLLYLGKDKPKISFVYNQERTVNIIKSPVQDEDTFNEMDEDFRNRRHKQYDLESVPQQPYTILFIANPRLKHGRDYQPDPILKDKKLFYRMVDQALKSFEDDELLGNDEIWSRLRVITVFPPQALRLTKNDFSDLNLADGFEGTFTISNVIIDNILSPQEGMFDSVKKILLKLAEQSASLPQKTNKLIKELIPPENEGADAEVKCGIDVIFVLSASKKYTRSSAVFSDYPDIFSDDINSNNGQNYTLQINPEKPAYQKVVLPKLYNDAEESTFSPERILQHEYFCRVPGRVAINVLSARQKTFIHEFAHAMSSAVNGAIADEYADNINVQGEDHKNYVHHELFYINRRERQNPDRARGEYIPVPKRFMIFNGSQYYSDLCHPSARENWRGYFPETIDPTIPCIMDRSAGCYRFDKLITSFMYDRLSAKLNRQKIGGQNA